MKTLSLLTVILITLIAPTGAFAKGKPKAKPPTETPIPLPGPGNPAEALSPYIINLQQLLAIARPPGSEKQPLYTQTSGLLMTLRQGFVVEQEKAADAKLKNMFAAAINTADLITGALNDRDTALGNLKSSQAVAGGSKLEAPARKETISQGIKSGGARIDVGRAEAVAAERDREKQFIAQGAAATKGDTNAMSAMAANQWEQRAAAWRQKIGASYSQIK